jgi:type III secretory pathway component EscS
MGLMSLKGAIDTLQDEDMSIGDKLLSVTMSLSMALVSLTSAVNQFKQAELKKTAVQLKSAA